MIPDPIGDAVRSLRHGGLVAYPTETVWALGADVRAEGGVELLRRWKGRGEEPISVLVEGPEALEPLGFRPGPAALRLARVFWPGPLTLVMRCEGGFASQVAGRNGGVGVRCSSHPLASALARRLGEEGGGPVTATSFNRTGEPPARTRDEARRMCGSGADAPQLIDVERAEAGGDEVSTVVDCVTEGKPIVLRWGALPAQDLEPVLEEIAGA